MNYKDENTSDIETSIDRPSRSDAENSITSDNHEIQIRNDHIVFVYFDLHVPLNRDLIGSLRAINDDVEIYSNLVDCLNGLKSSNDKIFFISSSIDKELIKQIHDYVSVEAIFIFNSDLSMDKSKLPKLFGFYKYSEELFVALKNTLEWFEQTQIEFFVFERDQTFLWYQLWKEEVIKSNISSDKEKLVNMAEKYYRKNKTLLKSLDDFDYCYEKTDALQWCFSSPFPSRFLRHALSSRNTEYLDLCRFLINDVFHVIQQQSLEVKTNYQFYKGMKMTKESLHRLIKHTGKLICPKGFFTCTKSKKAALDLAQSADYRSDLRPVLFKINCDSTVPFAELPMKDTSGLIVFNVYTAFRVKSVNRGSISIIKLEPADEDGANLALANRTVELSSSSPTKEVSLPVLSNEEIHAQRLIQYGTVDQVLNFYKNLKTRSTRVLNTMGQLYADKKGDYKSAIKHYKQALKIQEKTGEDITETLTQLGIAHHNRREFDIALAYHNRALNLRKNNNQSDLTLVASNLIGIANVQCGQGNLSEALKNAQEALILNESIESSNDSNLAMNLAILANIQHTVGNNVQALEHIQRSLTILERCAPSDSLALASVLNNMGAIQLGLGLFSDAQCSFDRVLKICEKTLPQGHPKRITMEINIQRIEEIIKNNENNSQLQS